MNTYFLTRARNRVCALAALLLIVSTGSVAAGVLTVPVSRGEEVPIERHTASGDTVIIWTPSDFGVQPSQTKIAQALAKNDIEVWIADLHAAYFLPTGRSSNKDFPQADIGYLVNAAVARGKHNIILASSGSSARLLLEGARQWQLEHPGQSFIRGLILFHPSLYLGLPGPGEDAEYLPIAYATNLPVYIIQPILATTYLRLPALRNALSSGGARVFVHPLPGVSLGYHLRPEDEISEKDKAARIRLPSDMTRAVKLLNAQTPVISASKNPLKSGKRKTARLTSGLNPAKQLLMAPDFTLGGLDGRPYQLNRYRGKVVLVNFWATWCPPCVEEMPSMQRLYRRMKGKPFEILAVDVGEKEADIHKFLKTVPVSFPVLLDRDGHIYQQWKVYVYPTNFLIDMNGRIRYGSPGAVNWDETGPVSKINSLLDETGKQ